MEGLKKLKQMWDENPVLVLGVLGVSFAGAAKLIDAVSGMQSKHAYAKRMNPRKS